MGFLVVGCGYVEDIDGADFAWQSPKMRVGMLKGPLQDFLTPEIVDYSAEHMMTGMSNLGYGPVYVLADGLASARIEMHGMPWPCPAVPGDTRTCDGQQMDFKLLVGTQMASGTVMCPWKTALMHEMAHMLLMYTTGDNDIDHKNTPVWELTNFPALKLGECPPTNLPAVFPE